MIDGWLVYWCLLISLAYYAYLDNKVELDKVKNKVTKWFNK